MASWILVPSLVSLRNEFNALAPGRDKASDGSIGDSAHASSSSDHNPDETGATPYEDSDRVNEVHAIDVDVDLRRSGWSMARAVEIIVTRHRTGKDNRLQNVIYNRRIWSRSYGWAARAYNGSNPHDKHAHFSARYTSAQENDTRHWGLLEAEKESGETMSVQDVRDFFESANKAVVDNANATGQNRADRNTVVPLLRFAVLGLEYKDQTEANMLPGQFAKLYTAITGLDSVDEQSIIEGITPALVQAIQNEDFSGASPEEVEQRTEAALRKVLGGLG